MDIQKIKEAIENAFDNGASAFGVRAMTHAKESVNVGDTLDNSYHWDDGEFRDDEIDGTCTLGIKTDCFGEADDSDILAAIEKSKRIYGCQGEQIVICAGNQNVDAPHMDDGEMVIMDAEVIFLI